jgi:O-antigen/teichoic acid export membrane protein
MANDAVVALAAVMTPLIVTGILALPIFMRVWVGPAFAAHATPIGIIFLLGIWINGLAFIPYGLLQANNRPDLTAKFHAAELLPFLGILWFGVHYFGLIGAAWTWTLRVTIDALLLFYVTGQLRSCVKFSPCLVLLLAAPFFAPDTIFSLKTAFALTLILVSCGCSAQISPFLREVFMRQYSRLTPHGA